MEVSLRKLEWNWRLECLPAALALDEPFHKPPTRQSETSEVRLTQLVADVSQLGKHSKLLSCAGPLTSDVDVS